MLDPISLFTFTFPYPLTSKGDSHVSLEWLG